MGKGYTKLYRSEADIPQLWRNTALFCVYQKLKIVALWPEGTINKPSRVLALQLAVSRNTLHKAIEGLAALGLVEISISAKNTWALRVKYVEPEIVSAQISPEIGPQPASGVNLLETRKNPVRADLNRLDSVPAPAAPKEITNKINAPAEKNVPAVQNLSQLGSKIEPTAAQNLSHLTLYRNIFIDNIYKNPHYPPTQTSADPGFAAFWVAYPNKKGKQPALKKWNGGKFDPLVILPVLEQQKRLRDWVKDGGKFIPHAKTYLHQRRWEDVLPSGEEYYILDFKNPQTEREKLLTAWLEATNPELLKNDNQTINSTFEPDRVLFEQIVTKCGASLPQAFKIMRHGWKMGCASLRAILERTASYLDDLQEE